MSDPFDPSGQRPITVIHEPVVAEPPADKPRRNRKGLLPWLLLALLAVALAAIIWFFIIDDDDPNDSPESSTATTGQTTAGANDGNGGDDAGPETVVVATATAVPAPTPTPELAIGGCTDLTAPDTTTTYKITGVTSKLNQRAAPSLNAEVAGEFLPDRVGIVATGECLDNPDDGYVWWEVSDGGQEVWVAAEFLAAEGVG